MTQGRVSETYHAALAHGFAGVGNATRIGVVRRPTTWFSGEVDENISGFGPPEELLSEFQRRHEDLKMRGMCDEGAHNAAWEELRFERRYRSYLEDSDKADRALSGLVERIAGGEDIVLVCYEGNAKRCHRHLLVEEIENGLSPDA